MRKLEAFRQRYLEGDGEKVTQELHALSTDDLAIALHEINIAFSISRGRRTALRKAAAFIVQGTKQ